jgi:hypothetical protein
VKSSHWLNLPALFLVALGGCGGGGSIDSTPSITNLVFSSTSAVQGDGNGSITVTGSVSFTDAGGDVARTSPCQSAASPD